ncbi:lipocalin family protein [Flavobacterium sp. CYK-55]|uniref:lipocalin family protein n=1 Tax=Flavobacterium sp. CYK-55 TaxID=2835529 RepID=UPI001BD1018E|nr:DUF5004 domain-containing protein [Flavobacterium sp. CYK-55]MBS7788121.1 lipocalin family protein [Flavobacterium sp. CYK-55]
MKTKIIGLSVFAVLVLTSATSIKTVQSDLSEKLIGTWQWNTIIDAETKESMGLDMVTMGMASEVKTEFKKDKTYIESKLKKGTTDWSNLSGEWKIEDGDVLNLKAKDKWRPSKVVKMSNDSLLLQMNPKMLLLMIKKK